MTTRLRLKKKKKCEKCRVGATHRDHPPVAQLAGGVGQDENGEAEDSQQLHRMEEKKVRECKKKNQNK